jgi:hypothetical protein
MVYAAVLVVPALSAAQVTPTTDWPLTPGLRVRVLSAVLGDQPQTGSVVSATSDTLVFLPAKQAVSTPLSTPNIARIEVARGTHSRKLRGALWGLFAGAGAGAILAAATYKPPNCNPNAWCFEILGQGGETALGGALGGLVGIIAGTIVGARETDTWVPVAVPAR